MRGKVFFCPFAAFGRRLCRTGEETAMLLVNAVNTEGRPLEIFVKDGRIAAVGQELEALAGDNERRRI